MDWHERIASDPLILVGKPVIKGTRLSVEHIIEQLANGWSETDFLDAFPGLAREDLQACYAYLADTLRDVGVHPSRPR
jgi:uncharacterized protein (DUF433 family)